MSNFLNTPSTPNSRTKLKDPYKTFNNKQSHHNLYEILTYNIPEFHQYLKKNIDPYINKKKFDPYINIKQKAYIYDGETNTNSDKGEYIIEFIYQNFNKNSYFPINIYRDVHFTLHKYSSIPNKLHFCFEEYKYNRGDNVFKRYLYLEYRDNKIYIKQNQKINIHIDDINECKIIINTINNYISDTIRKKKEKCREISNNPIARKRGRVNRNVVPLPLIGNNELEEGEEGDVSPNSKGGTKKKKNNKLNSIKKQDLVEMCKKNKLKGYSKLNKEQLIKFMKKNI
jgi:hypothetical protein